MSRMKHAISTAIAGAIIVGTMSTTATALAQSSSSSLFSLSSSSSGNSNSGNNGNNTGGDNNNGNTGGDNSGSDDTKVNKELKTGTYSYTDKAGRTSAYKIYADNVDYSEKVQVVVRLHGDDDFNSTTEEKNRRGAAEIFQHNNAIVVAPQSPNKFNKNTWWQNSEINSAWLLEMLENEVFSQHSHIDNGNITWIGYSGGAEFITYELLVNNPQMVGNALMIAGGGAPYWDFTNKASTTQMNNTMLHWYVGDQDRGGDFDAYEATDDGRYFYSNLGYKNTSRIILLDTGHYDIQQLHIMRNFYGHMNLYSQN